LRGPAGPRRGAALRDLSVISDGAVLIQDEVVMEVGPGRRVENLAAARKAEVIDASGKVVMPAFVDCETSLVHARSSSDSLDRLLANSGVAHDVLIAQAKLLSGLSSHSLRRRSLRVLRNMAQYGTGTVETRAGYPLNESDIFKVLRLQNEHRGGQLDLISTLLLAKDPGADAVEWVRSVTEELLPKVRNRRLANFVDLQCGAENGLPAISVPLVMRIFHSAAQSGFGVKLHSGFVGAPSAVALAVRCGAVSVSNFRHISDDEIHMLAQSSTIAVFKPGMLLQSGGNFASSCRKMIDAAVVPVIASGYHPELSSSFNMQLMLMLACRFFGIAPEEAITAATINAAFAVGAQNSVGSIECGKQADILILSISDYRELAYYSGVNIVEKMVKRGRVLSDQNADYD
jgi:imidazolonepropionase